LVTTTETIEEMTVSMTAITEMIVETMILSTKSCSVVIATTISHSQPQNKASSRIKD